MRKLKYYLLSGIVLFTPLIGTSSGIGQLLGENLLEAKNGPNNAIVEQKDPELEALIEKIAHCESSGREDVVIVDTNGYYSYGVMQFQLLTFEYTFGS